ncbi:MAG: molybdopterin molybdotransferase MoeA [Acetobacteraceae bacterium]
MISLEEARAWLGPRTQRLPAEPVALAEAAGRVLAVEAPGLPDAPPAADIDGYAVCAGDTEGASDYAPLPVGGVPVVAGAPMPPGADAVLPAHVVEAGMARAAVPPGHGVVSGGAGGIAAGTVLRPPHLAVLARLGHDEVAVVRRPVVRLHVAGPKSGPDQLTPMLAALVAAAGGVVGPVGDLAVHAGRSGPGSDDTGIAAFGAVFAHGVLIRPGETSALGTVCGGVALLLPGDPLSCATVFALLAAPCLRRMGGRPESAPVAAVLTRKISSGLGQIDAVRVRLEAGRATPLGAAQGVPLAAGAGADGLVLVPDGSEGYPGGATVWVHLLP